MKPPTTLDMAEAADWLDINEDEDCHCQRVAVWLRWYAQRADDRAIARELGCSVRSVRDAERSRQSTD